jgi:hypothetical protein
MGTFGLCDYLNKKDIPSKILNLAVYEESAVNEVLKKYLDLFQPTHTAIIFHWQETAEQFLKIGEMIKAQDNEIKIITGGFTAGYFGANLLEKCDFLDYVIKGDPERPSELLLKNAELSDIPNLIYRGSSGIQSNGVRYCIDKETLSSISFCKMTHLFDYELYIKATEQKLGFPICIGRGCAFSCHYCGGSSKAFKLHSERTKPETRSIASVLADLKRLKNFTRKIYICYENDRNYIKNLFKAMKKDKNFVKIFHMNYGAWKLFDEEFLALYKDLFICIGKTKPVFELSPEVFDDEIRKRIKHGHVHYSIKELRGNLTLIHNTLGDRITTSIFFSRYHEMIRTYADMKKEISGIFRFKHELFCENRSDANIFYDHLSTDIASSYWENYVANPKEFETLISAIRRLKAREHFHIQLNNLCIYIPESLSEREMFRCELLIFLLKRLETYFLEIFHILFECLDDLMIDLVEDVIIERFANRPYNVFKSMDSCALLTSLRQKVTENNSFIDKIPFGKDLINLGLKKAKYQHRTPVPRSSYHRKKPLLDKEFISVHDHDYLDLKGFLKKLDSKGVGHLKPEKTVFIFLVDEIMSMTYETYNATLNEFEKGISIDAYYDLMQRRGIFTPSYHEELVNKLFDSNVLV